MTGPRLAALYQQLKQAEKDSTESKKLPTKNGDDAKHSSSALTNGSSNGESSKPQD
jgi:hypothetical protein